MNKLFAVAAVALIAVGTAQAGDATKGKKVYDGACFACHNTGAANSPKLGDKAAWTDRLAKGADTLAANAIKGGSFGAGYMPAKGGRTDLSDEDVVNAVAYMIEQLK